MPRAPSAGVQRLWRALNDEAAPQLPSAAGRLASSLRVVFVSCDATQADFDASVADVPASAAARRWATLPHDDSEGGVRDALEERFGIRQLPTLVLLNRESGLPVADGQGLSWCAAVSKWAARGDEASDGVDGRAAFAEMLEAAFNA